MSVQLETKKQSIWNKPFIMVCMLNMLLFFGFYMLVPTFSFFVKSLGGDEAVVGFVVGIFSVSSVIVRPFIGWFLDHKSRRLLLYVGAVIIIIVVAVYPWVKLIAIVILLRLLHGVAWSCTTTSVNTAACDIIPRPRLGEGLSYFGLTNTISMAISPAIGFALMNNFGFIPLFYASCSLAVVAFVLSLQMRFPTIEITANSASLRPNIKSLLNKDSLPAAAITLAALLTYGAVQAFVALYAVETKVGSGGIFFAAMAISVVFARLISGRVADRHGESVLVFVCNGAIAASLLLIAYGHSLSLFICAALLYGIGFGTLVPTMQTMALRVAEPEQRGAASSTILCAFDIGIGVGGIISGLLVKTYGYSNMFTLMVGAAAISLLLYLFWGRRSRSAFKNAMKQKQ